MTNLRQLFLTHNAQTTRFPLLLAFERAEGCYLYTAEGKPSLDLISGIGVSNIGHSHPKVVDAVKQQAEKYMHLMVYGEYVQAPQVLFAQKLASLLPDPLQSVYFTNSGAEAIEGALKLAKRYTGRSQIIAFKNSYHGSTHGALSVMGNEEYKQAYRPLLPGISFIRFNEVADLDLITTETACVLVETMQRFAFEHFGIVPDMLVLAKALGGGMPLGAFVSSNPIMSAFTENPILGHITTFGGHPVCCAAGMAALDVLLDEKLVDAVAEKEVLFRQLLIHPAIREVRGKGLWLAVQLESFDLNKKVIDRCIENGIITDWFLHCSDAMRLAPPLIITKEQIRHACNVIIEAIAYFS